MKMKLVPRPGIDDFLRVSKFHVVNHGSRQTSVLLFTRFEKSCKNQRNDYWYLLIDLNVWFIICIYSGNIIAQTWFLFFEAVCLLNTKDHISIFFSGLWDSKFPLSTLCCLALASSSFFISRSTLACSSCVWTRSISIPSFFCSSWPVSKTKRCRSVSNQECSTKTIVWSFTSVARSF